MFYRSLLAMALCILLIGCAATIRDKSQVQYVKEGFVPASLETGGLALLPVLAEEAQETYRRPFADFLNKSIQSLKPELKFRTWQETMSALNERGLAEKYQRAISTYRETAILDRNLLRKMGDALGVRYLLFVRLGELQRSSETITNPIHSIIFGRTTVKTARLNSFAQIWDCSIGDVVLEAQGAAVTSKISELQKEKGREEYSRVAAEGLARKLLLSSGYIEIEQKSPSEAVKAFYMAANEGKYSEAEKYLSSEALKAMKNKSEPPSSGVKGTLDRITRNGNIGRIEILDEKIRGTEAKVDFIIHFKDGKTKKESEPLIKENGVWKITIG